MALELNKKKCLVLCVMLILLNHHINGAKGAEPQDSKKGSIRGVVPQIGSVRPTSQVRQNEPQCHRSLTSEPITSVTQSGSTNLRSLLSDTGSPNAAPQSDSTNLGSLESLLSRMASAPQSGSASLGSLGSLLSGTGSTNPASQSGSTSLGSLGSVPPTSQVSQNEPQGSEPLASGPTAAAPQSGSASLGSLGSLLSSMGSTNAAPQSGSASLESLGSLLSGIGSTNPASQSGSTSPGSLESLLSGIGSANPAQVPHNGTQGAGPMNGSLPLIPVMPNKISDNGTKTGQPLVPCYFIFGDSLIDAGNNNRLQTLAKANFDPYGIDFKPIGNTGRFCNGRTTVDFMAELLGFDHYIPPSELTNGTDILQGLNFASAAAGIRDDTAKQYGDRITMKEQVDNFKNKVGEMAALLGGPKKATEHLGKCLYSVGLGSNDYLNNYFMTNIYQTSKLLTPEQYADDLIKQYKTNLMVIYDQGARKFSLTGVSQVGCSPNSLSNFSPDNTCVKYINDAIELFNNRLKTLVDTLNKDHPDAKFTYINSFGLFQELKDKASTYGFKVTTDGCCGLGKNKGHLTCLPGLTPCPNRNEYLFWDAYHSTEATNLIGAKRSYIKESPSDVYPYDIKTLITL